MDIRRQEIRTGLLVVITLAALVGVLLYLGAPGVFVPQRTYHIFFENASGIKQGADVMLAGRKVGLVGRVYSPVPEAQRPERRFEVLIDVEVADTTRIYRDAGVQLVQTSLLGDILIDFYGGTEGAGIAPEGAYFKGSRQLGLNDAAPLAVEKLDPVLKKATETLETLQETARNLTRLTQPGADLPEAFGEFRRLGLHLNELSGPEGSLRKSLTNIETLAGKGGKLDKTVGQLEAMTAPNGDLSKTFRNSEQFTRSLSANKDLPLALRNLRQGSGQLNRTLGGLSPQLDAIGHNLEQATDTVKRQPWRLIWPGTKKYPEDKRPPATPVPKPRDRSKR